MLTCVPALQVRRNTSSRGEDKNKQLKIMFLTSRSECSTSAVEAQVTWVTYLAPMKHFFYFVSLTLFFAGFSETSFGQTPTESSWGFNDVPDNSQVNQMSGPRFGFTYVSEGSGAQFLNRVHEMDSAQYNSEFGNGLPFTYTTQYGWQWETRFADTGGPVVGLVEWVALIGGMEKGLFLPSFSSLVGVRSEKGVEFATGPNLSTSGLGFVFALGYNYTKGDLNLPINIAFVPDKQGPRNSALGDVLESTDYFEEIRQRETGFRLTVSVGFNLRAQD